MEWNDITVEEPNQNGLYLAFGADGMDVMFWDYEDGADSIDWRGVTHWAECPAPPT